MDDPLPMHPPANISPVLAALSCISFAALFVGSLYLFPLKRKQPREHGDRYLSVPAATAAEDSPRRSTATTATLDETPPFSPRTSSSSTPSLTRQNNNSSRPHSIHTDTIVLTKSPLSGIASADNRAHRNSTHLLFIDAESPTASSPRLSSTQQQGSLLFVPPGVANALTNATPGSSSSTTTTATITTTFSISKTSGIASARPEVVNHHHHSSSTFSSSSTALYDPALPARLQALASGENPKLDRDHPLVIMQRFKGILLTCCVIPFYLWWVFRFSGAIPSDLPFWTRLETFLGTIGISMPNHILKLVNHAVIPLFLVAILFMGPLLMMFLSNELPFQQAFNWAAQRHLLRRIIGMRNFVVGPISEEFVFRACMVAIVYQSGTSAVAMIFGLPLVFGVAHIHHGYESYVNKGRTRRALKNAAMVAGLQLTYTTIFGWFATFLFLRTSNLVGPCLVHSFCNMMGFPDVTNIQYYGRWKNGLYLAFVAGVVLFGVLLMPLTDPRLYGNEASCAYWTVFMPPGEAGLEDGGGSSLDDGVV